MNVSKVVKCSCKHKFQDKQYGLQLRLARLFHKPIPGGYKCTVCNQIHH